MNLRDLARLAKLSTASVSLALRDSPKISAATKARVRRLAEQAGYRADARLVEMMRYLRRPSAVRQTACLGVISFYEELRPWERSAHFARIHQGMTRRSNDLGYRLEPLWLRAPGMTYRRFRNILETRGIEGLLCFGSPNFDQVYPPALDLCAVVTQGLSIRTPMHRVISHAFHDMEEALNRLHKLGYRRPGLVISHYEDLRNAHAHSAAYLSWCERHFHLAHALPILRVNQVEPEPFLAWLGHYRPDVVVFVHLHEVLRELSALLRQNRVRVPRDLGVLAISSFIEDSGFDGFQENAILKGAWMVELLIARIANRDFGIPAQPRTELVESHWVRGHSLRRLGG